MVLSLIVAASENNVIGAHNRLPWHLPDDLKRFRTLTKGHTVIMGRKTYESIGRPLPERRNIVISRRKDFVADGCIVSDSLDSAIAQAGAGDIFVIGGGEIYRAAMAVADRIVLTRVHATIEGDAFFPEISLSEWKEVSREEHPKDDRHPYAFTFILYERLRQKIF